MEGTQKIKLTFLLSISFKRFAGNIANELSNSINFDPFKISIHSSKS